MAKSNRRTTRPAKKRKTKKELEAVRARNYFFSGLIFVVLGLFGALKVGFLGNFVANIFRAFTGQFYGIAALLTIVYGLVIAFKGAEPEIKNKKRWFGLVLLYIGCLIFLQGWFLGEAHVDGTASIGQTWHVLLSEFRNNQVKLSVGGGLIGAVLYRLTFFLGGKFGAYLFGFLFCGVGAGLIAGVRWQQVQELAQNFGQQAQEKASETREKAAERRAERQAEKAEQAKNKVRERSQGEKLAQAVYDEDVQEQPPAAEQLALKIENYQQNQQMGVMDDAGPIKRTQTTAEKLEEVTEEIGDDGQPLDFAIAAEIEDRDYELPASTLLDEIPQTDQSNEYSTIEKNVGVLEQTFKSFGVDAKVIRASLGPSVTKYEIQPAVGVKVSKIVNLTDDLALALAAKDIRIEAPIPGKSLVGIEVPNQKISMVSFRDVIEAQSASEDHLLEVPLGRDISGSVISADLAKMPHMLIAGSTGSGKSVCINGIITSILMRAKPHEVKLMMVDPKMVELNVYNGIPHLLTPVVTNPRKASQALHKVVEEMERRYELFANTGVRNITGYNQLVQRQNAELGKAQPILPFIVVIVDELADLMMVASNEVEDAIIRLAQMARAAGIHMILATQRPSVDVITGIIKANVPSRIAFAVSSGTDSRTIIDSNGAEKLLGRGDMLFMPMGENKPVRVQGAFISDQEVERVVAAVTEQQGADYQENMMPSEETEQTTGESEDELYPEVLQLVLDMQTASASLIQRRFKVGYNRAARLVDELEMNGVIGPSEGSKPRKVLWQAPPEEEPVPPTE